MTEQQKTLLCEDHLGSGIYAHQQRDPNWLIDRVLRLPRDDMRPCAVSGCKETPDFAVFWWNTESLPPKTPPSVEPKDREKK